MPCPVLPVDPHSPDDAVIAQAAVVLRGGGLVAFPTETVYGLGANALNATAVARVFAAKGRPATNPLIVHVPNVETARTLVADWPLLADRLAREFWPGPLTLVVPRLPIVPDAVTAGGSTVALRVPAHPVALALLQSSGLALAAPSANRSTEISPTCAEHVLRGMGDRIDLLLDAGPAAGGLESTVLDVCTVPPRLLRPGLITPAQLAAMAGPIANVAATTENAMPPGSPGLMRRHYAPGTPLELVPGNAMHRVLALVGRGQRVGWIRFPRHDLPTTDSLRIVEMPENAADYAARLYAVLHELDRAGLDRIVCELPPATDDWLAIHDRLTRAATVQDTGV
jgi:L-threonylcarbamoyladenylate synthase